MPGAFDWHPHISALGNCKSWHEPVLDTSPKSTQCSTIQREKTYASTEDSRHLSKLAASHDYAVGMDHARHSFHSRIAQVKDYLLPSDTKSWFAL